MYRRYRERRQHRRRYNQDSPRTRRSLTSAFRHPAAQIGFLLFVALVIFLILQSAAR